MHTLTSLSQPQETIKGSFGEGEKRTQETQSVCWPSSMVYLQSARVFHRRTVLSREPETICLLSALNATELTSEVCFWKVRTVSPMFKSHSLRVLSHEPERAKLESLEMTTSCTHWEWPVSARRAKPTPSASGESCKFQTMIFLSAAPNVQNALLQLPGLCVGIQSWHSNNRMCSVRHTDNRITKRLLSGVAPWHHSEISRGIARKDYK